jgi:hypothetical protein
MFMPKEMENVYLFFTWIISWLDNAFSGEAALWLSPFARCRIIWQRRTKRWGVVGFLSHRRSSERWSSVS